MRGSVLGVNIVIQIHEDQLNFDNPVGVSASYGSAGAREELKGLTEFGVLE